MADDRIDVKVGATTGELKSGMDQAKSTVQQGVAGMQTPFTQMRQNVTTGMQQMNSQVKGSLDGIGTVLTGIGKIALGVGAVLAGGAIFKGVIDTYVQINSEAKKLSVVMGLNIGDAQAMLESFKRVGVEGDTVTRALVVMTRQLKTNEEGFTSNGVATRDAGGNLLNMNEIMFNAINRLKEMKEGTERNMMATTLFGRSVSDMPGFLKMTQEAVAAMKQHLADLGITLDDVSAAKARAFKEGMHDVELVFTAMKYKIGQEVIPEFIKLGKLFSEEGPSMIRLLTTALKGVDMAFIANTLNFNIAKTAVIAGYQVMYAVAEGFFKGLSSLMQGHYEAAAAQYEAGLNRAVLATRKAAAEIKAMAFTAQWKIEVIMSSSGGKYGPGLYGSEGEGHGDPGQPKKDGALFNPKTPGGGGGGGGGGGANQVQVWKQELEEMKLAEKQFLESTLQDERKYWTDKLSLCREGSKEEQAVRHELLMLEKQIARQEHQERLADLKTQMADERKNSQERLALQDQALKLTAKNYGLDSVQYQNALREKKAMLLQFSNEQRQLEIAGLQHERSLYAIDQQMARADLNFQKQMGLMSEAQKLQSLKRIQQAEKQYYKQKLVEERSLYKQSEKGYKECNDKIELLERQHLADMAQLDQEYSLALKTQFDTLWSSLTSTFTNALLGMVNGTMTFGQAVGSIFQSLGQTIISMIADVAMKYIASQAEMLVFGQVADKAAAASGVGASAAEAGAAGFASAMLALPFPANVSAAPGVGFAAAAQAMGFLSLASAAGGWDVPADTLAMVHKDEKILPADWPEKLRAVAAPGGGAAGGIQIDKLNIAPMLVLKQNMSHAYAAEITRKYLFPAFKEELERFGLTLGRN